MNQNLNTLARTCRGLLITGSALSGLAIFLLLAREPIVSAFLLYLGAAFIALAIFGYFLKVSVSAIIEGLGGNLSLVSDSSFDPSRRDRSNEGALEAMLTGSQWSAWKKAKSPDLKNWVEDGSPDFMTWLKDKK